jgi:hypothetical protein
MTAPPHARLAGWLACDAVGSSSLAMLRRLGPPAGLEVALPEGRSWARGGPEDYPVDSADFGRCVGLLDARWSDLERAWKAAAVGRDWSPFNRAISAVVESARKGRVTP